MASTQNLLRWTQHTTFAGTPLAQAGLTQLVTQALRIPATVLREPGRWLVLLPETARLVRCLVSAWLERLTQLPLPIPFAYDSS